MEIPVSRTCPQPIVGASLSWGCPDPALLLDDIKQGTLLGLSPDLCAHRQSGITILPVDPALDTM